MNTKRGRPGIKPYIKQLIYAKALENKGITRLALAVELRNLIVEMGEIPPTEETMIKLISEGRNLPYTAEDKPWSVAASVRYGLSPEASKDLFDIWRASLALDRPISIRQAKWIVYIRNLYHQDISTGNVYSDKVNRNLWLIRQSWLYSILERASQIMGEQNFDTTDPDAASFMRPWEHATAVKLGKVSSAHYPPQEALAKLEKHGTSLTSPSVSVKSVEQAVWLSVRAGPPPQMELDAIGSLDEVLPEQYDLVAAYWLMHLSKGPLWNDLPESPEVEQYFKEQRKLREQGHSVRHRLLDWPDDSLYSRQLAVRHRLLDWVKTDSTRRGLLRPVRTGSAIEQYLELTKADLPDGPPFNATLLKTVGYEVTPEQMGNWLNLHKAELRLRHKGFLQLAADVQARFVNDEQTYDDRETLEEADSQAKTQEQNRQQSIEHEFIDTVKKHGEPSSTRAFWNPIIDEWNKRYPHSIVSRSIPVSWRDFEAVYERLIQEHNQNNKDSDSSEGGTK